MRVAAYYFDGKSSRRYTVELTVESDVAYLSGEIQREYRIPDLRVSERTRNTARKVTCPDGGYLEIQDRTTFNTLLADTGYRDSLVVRMQQSWRSTLLALFTIVAVLVLGYLFALPLASEVIADAVPESVERTIGTGTLAFLDKHLLAPSTLPAQRREAIMTRFQGLSPPFPNAPQFELVYRKGNIGPNAFALPSGQIVLTDEIVNLVNDDDAVMAILAHEMGHLYHRHLLRRIIQTSTVGAVATLLFGDISSAVANLPTLVLDMKYSRDAEREADDYAIAMLKKNDISLAKFALVFDKLGEKSLKITGDAMPYLSSHPASAERIARIKAAQ